MAKRKKVLYFIRGHVPTDAERAAAEKLDAAFRNVSVHTKGERLEEADEVYGAWPEGYDKLEGCKADGDGLAGILKAEAAAAKKANADKK